MRARYFLIPVLLLLSTLAAGEQPGTVTVNGTVARHILQNGGHLNVSYLPVNPATGKPDLEARESQVMEKLGQLLLFPPTSCFVEIALYDKNNKIFCFVETEKISLSRRGKTIVLTRPKVVPVISYHPGKGAYTNLTFKASGGLTYTWPGKLSTGLKARVNMNPRIEFYFADNMERPAGRTRVDYG